ncbi:MAG: hypothetical protein RLZZ626_75 [Actinomycetota bacterium]
MTLTAPAGSVFISVDFASFGNPQNFAKGSCDAASSVSAVSKKLLGRNSAKIVASVAAFGDPCPAITKTLQVKASYAVNQPGLQVKVYKIEASGGNPARDDNTYPTCDGAWTQVDNVWADWGGGTVANCQPEYVMIHYYGFIQYQTDATVTFTSWADDGFSLDINGSRVIENWTLKGCSGGSGAFDFKAGVAYPVDMWWFEWGGGACNELGYSVNGSQAAPVPSDMFSWYGVPIFPPVAPAPATISSAVAVNNGAKVTWTQAAAGEDQPAVEEYFFRYKLHNGRDWFETSTGSTSLTRTVANLAEKTSYDFEVNSYGNGMVSGWSAPVTVTTGSKANPGEAPANSKRLDVQFGLKSAVLSVAMKAKIKSFVGTYPFSTEAYLAGYCDTAEVSLMGASPSTALSLARANAVAGYLKSLKVKWSSTSNGLGATKTVGTAAQNRRTEIYFVQP